MNSNIYNGDPYFARPAIDALILAVQAALQDHDAALTAVDAACPVVPAWLPIESAPKDVEVWAFGREGYYSAKLVEVQEFLSVGRGSRQALRWHNLSANVYSEPTHWMPLPSPPSEAK